jgi:hypothetical protein
MMKMKRNQRLETAQAEFQELWKEVEPFVKKRKIKIQTTVGEWRT